ncbi:MAG: methyltransferase family protein [Candidatus Dormibacteria bacterium]
MRSRRCQAIPQLSAAAALTYQIAFVAIVFVVNPRRTLGGRSGWVDPRQSPPLERAASAILAAGCAAQIGGQLVAAVSGRAGNPGSATRRTAGAALASAATALAVAGQGAMTDAWSTSVSTTSGAPLVTHGPFAAVRNPVYASFIAASVAAALIAPTPVSLPAVGLVVAGLELQVRAVEEPMLARVHGDRYRRYRGRTGRFLPHTSGRVLRHLPCGVWLRGA